MTDADIIRRWRQSPLHFIADIWGLKPQPLKPGVSAELPADQYSPEHFQSFVKGKHLTWQQWLFFRAIEWGLAGKAPLNISVSSGHGTAKSCSLSFVIFWGLCSFLDSQLPCTAPTSDQLFDVLWKEAAKWHRLMPKALGDLFELQSQYIRVKERPETWWARARTARKEAPEALAGVHGDVVIIIVDEASGVPEEIFEVAQGALTGKLVIFLMVSNPTRLSGYFYESHHKHRLRFQCLTFNSEDSPIVEAGYPERIAEQYGRESPQYSIRVQGRFPDSEEDQLISRTLFDIAAARPRIRDVGYVRCLGVDVAYYGGDRTALVDRQGGVMEVRKVRSDQDTVATANDVMAELKAAKNDGNPYDFVMVDVIGIGAGVYDTLKERQKNGEIPKTTRLLAVNVAESAEDEKEHHNRRVELWHRFKKWLETGAVEAQLRDDSCAIKYGKPDNKGRNTLELKEDTRERLGQSPDLGDAGVLTFAVGNLRRKAKNEAFEAAVNRKKPVAGWMGKLQGSRVAA